MKVPALLIAASLFGGTVQIEKQSWVSTANLATATAIDSAVWTGWIPVADKRSLALEITYANNNGTAVTMVCETSNDKTTSADGGFELHSVTDSDADGTSTSVQHTWSNAVSGNELWTWTVANLPHDYINCAFTAAGGDGDDTAIVRYRGVTP